MKKYWRRLAALLALSLVVTSMPYTAKAAAKPAYKTERTSLYENAQTKGVYTYTVANVKKGQTVKWTLTGAGKSYASLKYTTTVVKGSTASNKVTIKTNSKNEARNAVLAVNAKVYSSKGVLQTTLKDKVKLKVQATDIAITTAAITDDLTSLSIGKTYDFDASVLPANTTSGAYWSVTGIDGKDYSSEITADGKWTPTADGKYTIKVMAKNSKTGKTLVYHTASVTVGLALSSVKQTAANQFYAVFSNDARDKVKAADLTIAATNGSGTIAAKSIEFISTGKAAYVTTYSNFKDKASYTITYQSNARAFIASVGEVKKAEILTATVEVGKETPVEYALYDENNIDVKAAAEGTVNLSAEVVNGYLTEEDSLLMYTEGKTANVTLTFEKKDSDTKITANKVVTCVAATVTSAASTDFTLTSGKTAPDFTASNYQPVTTTAIGETTYAHFRALDANKKEIKYNSVKYSSSDDNMLIIDADGKLTPIKIGTVKVTVAAVEGEKEVRYTYNVTIAAQKTPAVVALSSYSVTMSNVNLYNYAEYIDVAVKDQYGAAVALSDVSCTIKETGGKTVIASYDRANKQIVLNARGVAAGTYTYTATLLVNGVTLTTNFVVVVQAVPTGGAIGYQIQANHPNLDMVVDATTTGNKTVSIYLKKYIGGVFAGYNSITSATVSKDGQYYANDLTAAGQKTEQINMITNGNMLELTAVKLSTSNSSAGECIKASAGVYTITLKYSDSTGTAKTASISITLTDSQEAPTFTVTSTSSSKTVQNALALVNSCVKLSDDSVIYDCTVTGYSQTGETISIVGGQKLHIDTISVKKLLTLSGSQKVYVYYTLTLDKTLTNKN